MVGSAQAQESSYPSRAVRLVVGFPPGGGVDIVARVVSAKLGEVWKQPVTVDNRPGGSTILATDLVAHAPPDGYTLLLASSSYSINAAFGKKLPYDPLKDLTAVTQTAFQPYIVVVNPKLPVRTVKELIAYAHAKPGTLNYGSPGAGSGGNLAGEQFKLDTKTELVHVPYKGAAQALTDILSGQIQMMFPSILAVSSHIKSGGMRAIAVTSPKRSAAFPDVPTVAESGVPGFEAGSWNGVMVPGATPAALVTRLNRDLVQVLKSGEVRDALAADGAEPVGNSPEEFSRFVRNEIQKWTRVINAAGIKPD